MHSKLRLKPWFASLALAAGPAAAQAPEPGELWEQTVEMDMAGFTMPGHTGQFCAPKRDWKKPPPSQGKDDSCKVSDVKVAGDRMTWKVECPPPEAMTGTGDLTHTGDAFHGVVAMRSRDGEVKMKLRGKRLGGACDAGAQRRAVEAARRDAEAKGREAQAQQAQAMAQACDSAIKAMNPYGFEGPSPTCPEGRRAEFCGRLATRQGNEQARYQVARIRGICGRDPDAYLPELCATSRKEVEAGSGGREVNEFLVRRCPVEARAVAQRLCAGRSYTGIDERYRDFCSRSGSAMAEGGQGAAGADEKAKKKAQEDAAEQAKKALRGLFGK